MFLQKGKHLFVVDNVAIVVDQYASGNGVDEYPVYTLKTSDESAYSFALFNISFKDGDFDSEAARGMVHVVSHLCFNLFQFNSNLDGPDLLWFRGSSHRSKLI